MSYKAFVLGCLSLLLVGPFCQKATDGFSLNKISSSDAPELSSLGDEALAVEVLQQPFFYLGKGGQSYAFASADGQYVLKFFHNRPNPFVPRSSYKAKKYRKLQRAFEGYHLVYKELGERSGLLFLHLNNIPFQKLPVTLVDKLNIAHSVDLNTLEFVLQKKAESVESYLKQHPQEGLQAMRDFFQTLAAHQIADEDPRSYANMGFVGQDAVLCDPGRCVKKQAATQSFSPKFEQWLSQHFPELECR
jgi:hypothetical protein